MVHSNRQVRARRLPLLAVALIMACALPAGVSAQEEGGAAQQPADGKTVTTQTTTYKGWTVVCTSTEGAEEQVCSANFRVVNQQNNQNMLVWLFGRNPAGEPLAEFNTLTDVLIKPGVVIALDDGDPLKAGYVSCATGGCKASLALDKEIIGRMKEAQNVRVDMTRLDGQVVQFKFDVAGIESALAAIGF